MCLIMVAVGLLRLANQVSATFWLSDINGVWEESGTNDECAGCCLTITTLLSCPCQSSYGTQTMATWVISAPTDEFGCYVTSFTATVTTGWPTSTVSAIIEVPQLPASCSPMSGETTRHQLVNSPTFFQQVTFVTQTTVTLEETLIETSQPVVFPTALTETVVVTQGMTVTQLQTVTVQLPVNAMVVTEFQTVTISQHGPLQIITVSEQASPERVIATSYKTVQVMGSPSFFTVTELQTVTVTQPVHFTSHVTVTVTHFPNAMLPLSSAVVGETSQKAAQNLVVATETETATATIAQHNTVTITLVKPVTITQLASSLITTVANELNIVTVTQQRETTVTTVVSKYNSAPSTVTQLVSTTSTFTVTVSIGGSSTLSVLQMCEGYTPISAVTVTVSRSPMVSTKSELKMKTVGTASDSSTIPITHSEIYVSGGPPTASLMTTSGSSVKIFDTASVGRTAESRLSSSTTVSLFKVTSAPIPPLAGSTSLRLASHLSDTPSVPMLLSLTSMISKAGSLTMTRAATIVLSTAVACGSDSCIPFSTSAIPSREFCPPGMPLTVITSTLTSQSGANTIPGTTIVPVVMSGSYVRLGTTRLPTTIPGAIVTEVETVTFCGDVPVATKSLSLPVAVSQTTVNSVLSSSLGTSKSVTAKVLTPTAPKAIGTSATVKIIAYSSRVPFESSLLQVPCDMDIAARESQPSLSNMTVGVGVFTST